MCFVVCQLFTHKNYVKYTENMFSYKCHKTVKMCLYGCEKDGVSLWRQLTIHLHVNKHSTYVDVLHPLSSVLIYESILCSVMGRIAMVLCNWYNHCRRRCLRRHRQCHHHSLMTYEGFLRSWKISMCIPSPFSSVFSFCVQIVIHFTRQMMRWTPADI